MTEVQSGDLIAALDEASIGRVHLRAVVASGIGFFTDAYDLFVIGIASALITKDWHLNAGQLSLLNSVMLGAAFLGALVFGRYADVVGRKRVYWLVAAIMIAGALGSALSGSYWVLLGFRFLLGFGVGGDYPVSAVMVSEYANRKDRGKLVGMVFGTQALGLIIGPLVALALLGSGVSTDMAWRVLLGLGAVPAAAVIYLRCRMPESPRYQAQVRQRAERAAARALLSPRCRGAAQSSADGPAGVPDQPPLADHAGRDGRLLVPAGLRLLRQHHLHPADPQPDRPARLHHDQDRPAAGDLLGRGRARLHPGHHPAGQDRPPPPAAAGFAVMALCFLIIGAVPGMTTTVAPFLLVYGVSYFFTEFGPNMTTFVLPSELYPVDMRATGHGISAGIGKLGAFIGVFLFPLLQSSLGLRGTLLLTAGVSVLGFALTLVLPEPAGRSLEDIPDRRPARQPVAVTTSATPL